MVDMLTAAFGSLGPDLLLVAEVGLVIGVSIYGLKKAWNLFRYFTEDYVAPPSNDRSHDDSPPDNDHDSWTRG